MKRIPCKPDELEDYTSLRKSWCLDFCTTHVVDGNFYEKLFASYFASINIIAASGYAFAMGTSASIPGNKTQLKSTN